MTTCSRGSDVFLSPSTHKRRFYGAAAIVLLASACLAQQSDLPDAPSSQLLAQVSQGPAPAPAPQSTSPDAVTVTIPAGTQLTLVLTHPVDSRKTRRGDQVFAQTTTPVISGEQVVIPGGTYLQGKVEKLTRRGTQAEMLMQSISLIFPNGYIAKVTGPANIESDQWTAWNNPSAGSKAAMFLVPLISLPLGALIGHAADGNTTTYLQGQPFTTPSHKGLVIGTTVGFVGGLGTSFVLVARSKGFYIDSGAPMTMRLPQALTLTQAQIDDANQKASSQPPPPLPKPTGPPAGQGPGPAASPLPGPTSCGPGEEWCEGRCMSPGEFVSNDSNCGRCGNRCSFNESCFGTSCSCAAGYTSCMGQCVSSASFISDNNNCGSCGHSCSMGESCTGGTCMKTGR